MRPEKSRNIATTKFDGPFASLLLPFAIKQPEMQFLRPSEF